MLLLVCFVGFFVSSNLKAQNTFSNSIVETQNNFEYKLLKQVSLQEVQEMSFDKLVEVIPTQLKKNLKKVYRKKDNLGKEKFVSSLKLMIIQHIKSTN